MTLIEPGILIGLFTLVFVITSYYIFRRDILYGLVYLFLFIYVIFAQIGYAYFPKLSEVLKAYFSEELFYSMNLFVTLSFIVFFIMFYFFYKYVVRFPAYKVVKSRPSLLYIFYIVITVHVIALTLYFYANYNLMIYENVSDEDFQARQGLPLNMFIMGFKYSVVIILVLYFILRVKIQDAISVNRMVILFLLFIEFISFSIISFKIGNRADPMSLMLGITFIEIELFRKKNKIIFNFFKLAIAIGALLFVMGIIEANRGREGPEGYSLIENILFKDYFAPPHILIAAMGLHYVDPLEVMVSNSANALIMLKHPYLQETVTSLFNPGVSTRSTGYAFYIFSEGYLALGWLGFIYNGVVVFLGVSLWKRLSYTNNRYYNLFMLGLMATQVANIARGQSSYFIKDIYMIFLPSMFLFYLGTGLMPWFGCGIQKNSSVIKLQE